MVKIAEQWSSDNYQYLLSMQMGTPFIYWLKLCVLYFSRIVYYTVCLGEKLSCKDLTSVQKFLPLSLGSLRLTTIDKVRHTLFSSFYPPDHHRQSQAHSLLFILPVYWHWLQRDTCYNQAKSLSHRTLLAVNGHFVVSVCPRRLIMVRCTRIVSINIRFRITLTTTNFPTSHVTLLWCTLSLSVLLPYDLSKVILRSLPFTSKCILRFTPELVFVTFCSVNGMVWSPFVLDVSSLITF